MDILMLKKWIFAAMLLAPSVCFAEFHWDKAEVDIQASSSDTKAVAVYEFTNNSDHAIKILSTQGGCDCASIDVEKKTYAPGEKGKLTATLTFGQRVGIQQ